jgi:AcrR family transcriptional regulator
MPATENGTESLREKQKRVAREAILQATADEIVERGLGELSLQAVAARAGVSIRTLYNYFESRDQLFLALGAWSDERTAEMGGWLRIEHLDGIPEAMRRVWRSWEEQGSLYRALLQLDAAGAGGAVEQLRTERQQRTDQVRAAITDRRPDLDDEELAEVAALVHAMLGPALWERMHQLAGLDADRSGRAAAWAIGLIIDALDRGDGPRNASDDAGADHDLRIEADRRSGEA